MNELVNDLLACELNVGNALVEFRDILGSVGFDVDLLLVCGRVSRRLALLFRAKRCGRRRRGLDQRLEKLLEPLVVVIARAT